MRKTDADPDKRYFRSGSRLFMMNNQWWFASREGDQGPFGSESRAQVALQNYIEEMQFAEQSAAQNSVKLKTMREQALARDTK